MANARWINDARSTLRILRENARVWWYHQKLREQGDHEEARQREHQSVRHAIGALREAKKNSGYLTMGHGGGSFMYAPHASITSFGESAPYFPVAIRMGLLVIDVRTADFDKLSDVTIRGPLPAFPGQPHDAPPYSSLSCAPLEYIVAQYRHIGATLYNDPWADTPAARIEYARRNTTNVEQPSLLEGTAA